MDFELKKYPINNLEEEFIINISAVAKVGTLMALCNDLENKLSQTRSDNDRLLESAVAEVLAA